MALVGTHQVKPFTSPVNSQGALDANVVRGNDNALRSAYVTHDADATIHNQSGLLANRPATPAIGTVYYATDVGLENQSIYTAAGWVTVATGGILYNGVYNVRAYGATGNNVTNDYTAIQNAVNAAVAAGGGIVYFPVGIYRVSQSIILGSNLIVRGEGRENTVVRTLNYGSGATFTGTHVFRGTDVENIVIEDMEIRGVSIDGNASTGIFLSRVNNDNIAHIIIRNVLVNDHAGNGIFISVPILCTFQNVKMRFCAGHGVHVDGGTSTNFYECYSVTCLKAGYFLDTMVYCALVGCAADVCGVGYDLEASSAIALTGCGCESARLLPAYSAWPGISYRTNGSRSALYSCYSRDPDTAGKAGHITGSWQVYNFRAMQSGVQTMYQLDIGGDNMSIGQATTDTLTVVGTLTHNGDVASAAQSTTTATVNVGTGTGSGDSSISIRGAAGTNRLLAFRTGTTNRWAMYAQNNAESGSNAGSTFNIGAYTDAGAFIDAPLAIARAAGGTMFISRPTLITGDSQVTGAFKVYSPTTTILNLRDGSGTADAREYSFRINAGALSLRSTLDNNTTVATALTIVHATGDATFGGVLNNNGIGASLAQSATSATVNVGTGTGSGSADLNLRAAAGQQAILWLRSGTSVRWAFYRNSTAESGANAGSELRLNAYDDTGTAIDTVMTVIRAASGTMTISRPFLLSGTGSFTHNGNTALLVQGTAASGSVAVGVGTQTGGAFLALRAPAANNRMLQFQTGTLNRWILVANTSAESGSDAGTNFELAAYTDAGALIDLPIVINRAAGGAMTLARPITHNGLTANLAQGTTSGAVVAVGSGTQTGGGFLRIRSPAAQYASLAWRTADLDRWVWYRDNTAESGSDVGSEMSLAAHTDAGVFIDNVIRIQRFAGGSMNLSRPITHTATLASLSQSATTSTVFLGTGSGSGISQFVIRGAAGQGRQIMLQTGTLARWAVRTNADAESGADAGSNLRIDAYTDAGVFIESVVAIARIAGGTMSLTRPISHTAATISLGQQTAAASLLTLGTATTPGSVVIIRGTVAGGRYIDYQSAAVSRWRVGVNTTAEAGADSGSNYFIQAHDDSGASIDSPLVISRVAGGAVAFATTRPVTMGTGTASTSFATPILTNSGTMTIRTTSASGINMQVNSSTRLAIGDTQLTHTGLFAYLSQAATDALAYVGTGAGTGSSQFIIRRASGLQGSIGFQTGTSDRWLMSVTADGELGSNAGSNYSLGAYDDSGTFLDWPLRIARAALGAFAISRPSTVTVSEAGTTSINGMALAVTKSHTFGTVGLLQGVQSVVSVSGAGGATTIVRAGNFEASSSNSTATSTVMVAIRARSVNSALGAVTNAYGLQVDRVLNATTVAAISIEANTAALSTNNYGLLVKDISAATNNYAIYTQTGLVRFGDTVNIATTNGLQVNGTKVVGAQGATIADPAGGGTVDAEARTAINTIIDRLQAHGLIA